MRDRSWPVVRRCIWTLALVLAAALVAACSGSPSPSSPSLTSAVATSAPSASSVVVNPHAGAFPSGVTVSVTTASGGAQAPTPPATSLVGGPYKITASDGSEPKGTVDVTFKVARSALTAAAAPMVVHDDPEYGWLVEATDVDRAALTVTAHLTSFSWLDVIDGVTWVAGDVTGNRSTGPSPCGKAPDWVNGVLVFNDLNAALRSCVDTDDKKQFELHAKNNRGYPVTLDLGDGHPQATVEHSDPDDLVSALGDLLARRKTGAVVLNSGTQAEIDWNRPAAGDLVYVHVVASSDALTYWTVTMASGLSALIGTGLRSDDPRIQAYNKIRNKISTAQGRGDCMLKVVALHSDPPENEKDAAAEGSAAVKGCSEQFVEVMKQENVPGKVIGSFSAAMKSLSVVDVFYKLNDHASDAVNGARADAELVGPKKTLVTCPSTSFVTSAVQKQFTSGATVEHVIVIKCSGSWASAAVAISHGPGLGSDAETELFHNIGVTWTIVNREQPCARKQLPQKIYHDVCEVS